MRMIIVFIFFVLLLFPIFCLSVQNNLDSDKDGLTDQQELEIYFTDPNNPDTDNDSYTDAHEINYGYSPRHADNKKLIEVVSDKDYLNDKWELILGTGLMNPDSDGDLYLDGTEIAASYDPLNPKPVKKEKLIRVSIANQYLEYFYDNKLMDSFPVSAGKSYTPTPKGEFKVLAKVPSKNYGGNGFNFYYPNTKWNLHFTTNYWRYYIHGAYWHNNFGNPMSSGCVNVSYDNMEPLYWFAQLGTKIIID